jgi:hypothetical protein
MLWRTDSTVAARYQLFRNVKAFVLLLNKTSISTTKYKFFSWFWTNANSITVNSTSGLTNFTINIVPGTRCIIGSRSAIRDLNTISRAYLRISTNTNSTIFGETNICIVSNAVNVTIAAFCWGDLKTCPSTFPYKDPSN